MKQQPNVTPLLTVHERARARIITLIYFYKKNVNILLKKIPYTYINTRVISR